MVFSLQACSSQTLRRELDSRFFSSTTAVVVIVVGVVALVVCLFVFV